MRWFVILWLACKLTVAAAPQGPAFTYQGHLTDSAGPANGSFDLTFSLFDSPTAGNCIGIRQTNTAAVVSNGLFTATVNCGLNAFNGEARWIEISVRTNGALLFFTLAPRQPLTAAPYALFALNAATTNYVILDPTNANAAFLVVISNQTAAAVAEAIQRATNSAMFTQYLPVNATHRGAVPDGVTDNAPLLSYLFNSGGTVYLPPGRYMISNSLVVQPNSPPITIISDSAELVAASTISPFNTLLQLNPGGCKVRGLTFIDGRPNTNSSAQTIFLNANGFAEIDRCTFLNPRGPAIVVQGDGDIYQRRNHWRVTGCTFSNYYGGVWAVGYNTSEFGIISDCQGANGIAFGLKVQSANCLGEGNSFLGPGGGYDPFTASGIGLWLVGDNQGGRLHDKVTGHYAHWKYGVWVEGCTTMLTLDHVIANGEFNMFKNCNGIQIIGGLYEAFQTSTLQSCTNTSVLGVDFRGQMTGWTNANGTANYTGSANHLNNVELPAYGNGGGWTNLPAMAGLTTNLTWGAQTLMFSNGVLRAVQ